MELGIDFDCPKCQLWAVHLWLDFLARLVLSTHDGHDPYWANGRWRISRSVPVGLIGHACSLWAGLINLVCFLLLGTYKVNTDPPAGLLRSVFNRICIGFVMNWLPRSDLDQQEMYTPFRIDCSCLITWVIQSLHAGLITHVCPVSVVYLQDLLAGSSHFAMGHRLLCLMSNNWVMENPFKFRVLSFWLMHVTVQTTWRVRLFDSIAPPYLGYNALLPWSFRLGVWRFPCFILFSAPFQVFPVAFMTPSVSVPLKSSCSRSWILLGLWDNCRTLKPMSHQ